MLIPVLGVYNPQFSPIQLLPTLQLQSGLTFSIITVSIILLRQNEAVKFQSIYYLLPLATIFLPLLKELKK